MRKILLIGIGAGDPDYLTVQAIDALNRADVFFIPDKGAEKAALRNLRDLLCERFVKTPKYRTVAFTPPRRADAGADYGGAVDEWHAALGAEYARLIGRELAEDECGAFLVWGDPSLYDSTLRILDSLRARGFALEYEMIPGVSAIQALAARHRIALNRIGEPVLITTGRKLAAALATGVGDIVVMLEGDQAFARAPGEAFEIYWGAYLGTADEILISGKLSEVGRLIERTRREARAAHGWIMDTYLLRRIGDAR